MSNRNLQNSSRGNTQGNFQSNTQGNTNESVGFFQRMTSDLAAGGNAKRVYANRFARTIAREENLLKSVYKQLAQKSLDAYFLFANDFLNFNQNLYAAYYNIWSATNAWDGSTVVSEPAVSNNFDEDILRMTSKIADLKRNIKTAIQLSTRSEVTELLNDLLAEVDITSIQFDLFKSVIQ